MNSETRDNIIRNIRLQIKHSIEELKTESQFRNYSKDVLPPSPHTQPTRINENHAHYSTDTWSKSENSSWQEYEKRENHWTPLKLRIKIQTYKVAVESELKGKGDF